VRRVSGPLRAIQSSAMSRCGLFTDHWRSSTTAATLGPHIHLNPSGPIPVPPVRIHSPGRTDPMKKGQLQVSKADSPQQGEQRDPAAPKIKRTGGSGSQTRAHPKSEGSSSKG
jgi:hypothetical protein